MSSWFLADPARYVEVVFTALVFFLGINQNGTSPLALGASKSGFELGAFCCTFS